MYNYLYAVYAGTFMYSKQPCYQPLYSTINTLIKCLMNIVKAGTEHSGCCVRKRTVLNKFKSYFSIKVLVFI